MSHYFSFNNERSDQMSMTITGKRTYVGTTKDLTFVPVPGRSGDVIIDNGRYPNIRVEYDFTLLTDNIDGTTRGSASAIINWLCTPTSYIKLTDDYNPGFFRMGILRNGLEIASSLPFMGRGKAVFNCKPFLYENEPADPWIGYGIGDSFLNNYIATYPIIRIWGSGTNTIQVGQIILRMDFPSGATYMQFDTETMEITYNHSTLGELPGNNYGTIAPNGGIPGGGAVFTKTGGTGTVTQIKMRPRWRKL